MYVLDDNGVKGECIIIDAGNKILEIKNIAIRPDCQRKGYGKALIDFIVKKYKEKYSALQVGTGDNPSIIPFYEEHPAGRRHEPAGTLGGARRPL